MQDITQSDVAVADMENTEMAYKNEILRYIQQKWCRQTDMGQVTWPTFVLATDLMPKARSNNLILLNLKGGIFKNIQYSEHATPQTNFPVYNHTWWNTQII